MGTVKLYRDYMVSGYVAMYIWLYINPYHGKRKHVVTLFYFFKTSS